MVTDLTRQEEAIESLDKKCLGAAIADATKLLGSSVISLASGRNTHRTVADVAAFRPLLVDAKGTVERGSIRSPARPVSTCRNDQRCRAWPTLLFLLTSKVSTSTEVSIEG